jgi:predicted dehydrogenase
MTDGRTTRVGFIGTGIMARAHLREMLIRDDTTVVAVCEPSAANYAQAIVRVDQHGLAAPPNEPDWERFVATFAADLDAVLIITPHVFHFAQASACLEAGIDVGRRHFLAVLLRRQPPAARAGLR